jgi:hypothetical protein
MMSFAPFKKIFFVLGICFLSVFCLLSCGLETFYYIDYIPQGWVADHLYAEIELPSSSTEGYNYFTNFVIYYRLYISNSFTPGIKETDTQIREISNYLINDYTNLLPYTDITSTTVNTSNLENTFAGRSYFRLELEGVDIKNVLSGGSLGGILEVNFYGVPGTQPELILNGVPYTLLRATTGQGIGVFTPRPDRRFFNTPDLRDNAYATSLINADTVSGGGTAPTHIWISMYIAAEGRSLETPSRTIYSQPTHIGIFMLADSS